MFLRLFFPLFGRGRYSFAISIDKDSAGFEFRNVGTLLWTPSITGILVDGLVLDMAMFRVFCLSQVANRSGSRRSCQWQPRFLHLLLPVSPLLSSSSSLSLAEARPSLGSFIMVTLLVVAVAVFLTLRILSCVRYVCVLLLLLLRGNGRSTTTSCLCMFRRSTVDHETWRQLLSVASARAGSSTVGHRKSRILFLTEMPHFLPKPALWNNTTFQHS
jgi:hypothetical protein